MKVAVWRLLLALPTAVAASAAVATEIVAPSLSLRPGDAYHRSAQPDFQPHLQNTRWFHAVSVGGEPDDDGYRLGPRLKLEHSGNAMASRV